jgi:hypothetical protein
VTNEAQDARPASGGLPRRTARAKAAGRHRSPDRFSVPDSAPVLVLAVPGADRDDIRQMVGGISADARELCSGIGVRAGYLGGGEPSLGRMLASLGGEPAAGRSGQSPGQPRRVAVVVPLTFAPNPGIDEALAAATAQSAVPTIVTGHLDQHPILAEALHDRLAEAGLVRARRVSGLSVSTTAAGVLVALAGGQAAQQAGAAVAVLLAARLGIPVMPFWLGDPASLDAALSMLREAGAARPMIAPCVIGPEVAHGEVEAIADACGASCAETLGAHPAIGRLIAMRYGDALLDRRLAAPGRSPAAGPPTPPVR